MTDPNAPQPDETILGGESAVPDTAGTAAGGASGDAPAPADKNATTPPER